MKLITFFRTCPVLMPIRYIGNSIWRSKAADKAIDFFCKDGLPYGMSRSALKRDMMREKSRRFFTFEEYFVYRLYALSVKERKTFISDYERVHFLRQVNTPENANIFGDKYETYLRFAKYYGREMMKITKNDEAKFREFASRHPSFIVKPAHSSFGEGVKLFVTEECPDVWTKFITEYPKGAVIEEFIIQSEITSRLHPQSVNTLRTNTFRLDGRTDVIFSVLRVGVGDSIVDNGGSGGIFMAVDLNSGVVTDAVDENGKRYLFHPDTGVQLVGYHVPMWEEAKALSIELAHVIPSNRYTGWDLALTEKGWIMVEGNEAAQFVVYQMPYLKGYRPELTAYYASLGIVPKFN